MVAVATALTVYGIETQQLFSFLNFLSFSCYVATALTVYGIETPLTGKLEILTCANVATALTVYGIETENHFRGNFNGSEVGCNSAYRLRY